MSKISTPWGQADHVDRIAPGIMSVSTPSHGGIMLDADHVARIPRSIGAGYSGTRSAWEEDCDWAVPYLLFKDEFACWDCVRRLGEDEMTKIARDTLARYQPAWLASIDNKLAQKELAL